MNAIWGNNCCSENHPKRKYNTWEKYGDCSVKLVVHNLLTTNLERVNICESKVVLYLS